MLLGRDALLKFDIHLYFNPIVPNSESDSKINKNHCAILAKQKNMCTCDFLSIESIPAVIGNPISDEGSIKRISLNKKGIISKFYASPPRTLARMNASDMLDEFAGLHVFAATNEIDIDPKLPSAIRDELFDLITSEYCNVEPESVSVPNYEMSIRLTNDTPFFCSPRRLSYREKDEVNKIVTDLMQRGVIRLSESPYASPIVLVKKKNGETRMCVDYRALNKLTVRDNFPIPLIEDCLEYLSNKRIFSLLDLKSGFHQVRMADDSMQYTSFVTPHGQFEYARMPFGLKNAPSVFQRFISRILKPFTDSGLIVVYFDDIIIASVCIDEHIRLVIDVLRCLAQNGLEIRFSKCKFAYDRIEYLGYDVSVSGIRPSGDHIRAICNYPVPTNTKELHSYLGLCSYFRRFVPSFSVIARPLHNLTKKDTPFRFDDNCRAAFDKLRDALTSAPILSIYDPKCETELHCDASSHGFGAVLLQKKSDGRFHPISYFSKSTTPQEAKYHSFELETLAMIYALRRFRTYLEGVPFRIVTDCNSLTLTLNRREMNPRIARWALELENYDYSVQHRPGARMGHADALSRCKVVSVVSSEDIDFQLRGTQSRDPLISELRAGLSRSESRLYVMQDGLVYRRDRRGDLYFYVPSEIEENLIRHVHEKIGHLGVTKCYDQLKMHYWFPDMQSKIEKYIRNCIKCIMYSAPARTNEHSLYNIPKRPIPFHTLHIDHFGPLPSLQSKRKHILLVVDAFTKYVKLYPVVSTSTREVCASLDRYFEYYSRPSRIVSDRGTCFTSLEFGSYLLDKNVEHVKVAVASPQANGQVERVNRTLKAMLSKLSEPLAHSDWVRQLAQVEYALNNTVQRSTKTPPSILLFGVLQRGDNVDRLTEYLDEKNVNSVDRDLNEFRDRAATAIQASQDYNLRQFNEKNRLPKSFDLNEFVVIKNTDTTIGTNMKLIPNFKGPYRIHKILPHDRYVIRDIDECQITQLPYNGIIEAKYIRKWIEPPIEEIIESIPQRSNEDNLTIQPSAIRPAHD